MKLFAGANLNDLDFMVLDENESRLELDPQWFEGRGLGYKASWVEGDKVLPISRRPLPPFQVYPLMVASLSTSLAQFQQIFGP